MSAFSTPRPLRAARWCIRASALGVLLISSAALAASPIGVAPGFPAAGASHDHPPGQASLALEHAIGLALARAPMLRARQSRLEAARQEAGRAGQLPDPELVVGIDNLPITGRDALDFSADEMTQKRIGVRQVLPARAKRAAARAVAARRVDEAVANSAAQAIEVRRATAEAWIDAWAAARELHALGLLREQAQLASRIATARVSTGAQSPSDALATQAQILELDNRIAGVEADRSAALADLSRWTGVELAPTADDAPDFGSLPLPAAQLLASIDRLAPVLQSSALVETAAAEVDAARAEKRLDWSVAAAFAQRDGGRSDMIMLEVGVGLPLFPRNRQNRGITARQAEYEATVEEREDLRRQLSAKIRADLARWQGLNRQVAIHVDSLLPLARDRSAVALAGYRAGGDLQPWIDARRAEIEAHLSHAEHLAELGQAWAALAFLLPEEGAR
jgi:outer membrane protein TolC